MLHSVICSSQCTPVHHLKIVWQLLDAIYYWKIMDGRFIIEKSRKKTAVYRGKKILTTFWSHGVADPKLGPGKPTKCCVSFGGECKWESLLLHVIHTRNMAFMPVINISSKLRVIFFTNLNAIQGWGRGDAIFHPSFIVIDIEGLVTIHCKVF